MPDRHDPRRTMLGDAHEKWLLDALATTKATWNLLAQRALIMLFALIDPAHPKRGATLHPADRWEGYAAARDRVFRRWVDAKTSNPVVLSGDIHAFTADDIRHPDRPDGAPTAAEFAGGSITSTNNHRGLREEAKSNPSIRFAENEVRGYARVDLRERGADVAFLPTRQTSHRRYRRSPNSGSRPGELGSRTRRPVRLRSAGYFRTLVANPVRTELIESRGGERSRVIPA